MIISAMLDGIARIGPDRVRNSNLKIERFARREDICIDSPVPVRFESKGCVVSIAFVVGEQFDWICFLSDFDPPFHLFIFSNAPNVAQRAILLAGLRKPLFEGSKVRHRVGRATLEWKMHET